MHELFLSLVLLLSELTDRESLRFETSMEQGYDTSCGLSALAAFLSLYWGDECDEYILAIEYLKDKIETGDFTVSVADLKRILLAKGFKVQAYAMTFEQLTKAVQKYAPVLIHYQEPEGHFAIVLSIEDDFVVTSDPAEGTIARSRAAFCSRWSGAVILAQLPGKAANGDMMQKAIGQARGRKEIAIEAIDSMMRVQP